jgi:ketosteroid isomerase-like protein
MILQRCLLNGVAPLLLLLFTLSCTPARSEGAQEALPSVALPPELDRVLRDYERAWQAHDADALAALFAEDGFVLSNNRPAVRGLAGIRVAYATSGGGLSLRALSFSVADTVGYIIGMFSPQAGQPDVGKFILALRRDAGGPWQIAADMDNGIRR